jgi:sporulation and spore germination protein/immunoglobulin-like protein involved in spore germination
VAQDGVERAAVEALLTGPTERETEAGLTTTVPGRTHLRDLTIENGVATVDLSAEFDDGGGSATMFMRLAQVVFTLTQFPGVTGVKFEIDGKPVETFSSEGIVLDGPQDRADFEDQSPGILVETPAVGDTPTSPFQLTGTANTFEANFQYEVLAADGTKLAGHFVTATCGTGCRGTFDETVTVDDPDTATSLVVWEPSAEDGSRTKVVKIPLDLSS